MEKSTIAVRLFGRLHTLRKERGLADVAEVEVSPLGRSAEDIARSLALPLDQIEAVFCNHRTYGLGHLIHPGDEVAFVPHGTPGPHRFTLGIRSARERREE